MLLKLLKKGLKSLGPKILKQILGSGDIIGALSEFGLGDTASQLGSGTVTDLVESIVGWISKRNRWALAATTVNIEFEISNDEMLSLQKWHLWNDIDTAIIGRK